MHLQAVRLFIGLLSSDTAKPPEDCGAMIAATLANACQSGDQEEDDDEEEEEKEEEEHGRKGLQRDEMR